MYGAAADARRVRRDLPRAYHGGFSLGFNIGGAVNFATPDWVQHARLANEHYRTTRAPRRRRPRPPHVHAGAQRLHVHRHCVVRGAPRRGLAHRRGGGAHAAAFISDGGPARRVRPRRAAAGQQHALLMQGRRGLRRHADLLHLQAHVLRVHRRLQLLERSAGRSRHAASCRCPPVRFVLEWEKSRTSSGSRAASTRSWRSSRACRTRSRWWTGP